MKKKHPIGRAVIIILFAFIFLEILCGLLVPYNKIHIDKLYRYTNETTFEHHGLYTTMTYDVTAGENQGETRYLVPNITYFVYSWFVVVPEHLEDINTSRYFNNNAYDLDVYEIDLANNGWLYPTEYVNPFPFPADGYSVHVAADAGTFPEAHDGMRIIAAARRLPKIPIG